LCIIFKGGWADRLFSCWNSTMNSNGVSPGLDADRLAAADAACYFALATSGSTIRHHIDLLQWLQGDFQLCVEHEVLISGWGNFEEGSVQHDVLSRLPGLRSYAVGTACLPFVLAKLHDRWVAGDRQPCSFAFSQFEYLLGSASLPDSFCEALRGMRWAVVHGISDQRGNNDCLYVFLTSKMPRGANAADMGKTRAAMKILLPVLDTALRQVSHLPQQKYQNQPSTGLRPVTEETTGLSERETQIMAWVAMGKTNSEIGSILNISGFTVKNHMQRIFQKLNVFNRAQAVSKVTRVSVDV
jgi:transcriptional regulator EpsA